MVHPALLALIAGGAAGAATTKKGKKFLFGEDGKFLKPQETLDEGQQGIREQILQLLQSGNQDAFDYIHKILSDDPAAFEDFEAPFKQQFNEEIVPGITERLGGEAGSAGALSSSSLNRSVSQAGRDLTTNLAALRSGLKSDAVSKLQQYTSQGLTPTRELFYKPGSAGAVGGAAEGAGNAGMQALLKYLQAGA